MNDILNQLLIKFNDVTKKMIDELENENYEASDVLLDERQDIIEKINSIKYTKEEFKEIACELKLLSYESKVEVLMNEKKCKEKENLNRLSKIKRATNTYNKGFSSVPFYVSKKVY